MRPMTTIVVDGFEYTVRPQFKVGLMESLNPYKDTRKAVTQPASRGNGGEPIKADTQKKGTKPKK